MVCNILSHAQDFDGQYSFLTNGKERSGLQHLESCTGVWVSKTSPFLLGRRELFCKIYSHTPEFRWARLPPC